MNASPAPREDSTFDFVVWWTSIGLVAEAFIFQLLT